MKSNWVVALVVAIGLMVVLGGCLVPVTPTPSTGDDDMNMVMGLAAARRTAMHTTAITNANGTTMQTQDYAWAVIQVAGTYTTCTVNYEGTIDGTNWVAMQAINANDGSVATTSTSNGIYAVPNLAGVSQLRARVSGYTGPSSGGVTVTGVRTNIAPGMLADTDGSVDLSSAVTVNDPISVTVGGQAVQLDDTDKQAVSIYGKDSAAGDIAINASAAGNWETDIHVAGQAPQMDDTDKMAVSLYGSGSGAGDTALNTDGSGNVYILPFQAVIWTDYSELIGINDEINTDDYSAVYTETLAAAASGYIAEVCLRATEDGSGAPQDSAGDLLIFDVFPGNIAAGATSLGATVQSIGMVPFYASDWDVDGGATVGLACQEVSIPFPSTSSLWFVWRQEDATDLNDAAGDDESLEMRIGYQRHS